MNNQIKELEGRLKHLETLARVSRVIHSTLDPRESLQLILGEAVRLSRANSGSISLVNPNTGFLEIGAAIGLSEEAVRLRLRVGEGLTGWVARTGRTVRVGDVTRDARYFDLRTGVASEMAVPLLVVDQVRGVLNLDSDRVDAFNDADQALLEEIATLAAPAIQNTWLYEAARQRAHLLESLVRVSQNINSTNSLADALRAITREARGLMRAKMCSLLMLDASGKWLELRAQEGAGEAYEKKPRLAVDDSLLGIVVRRRKPLQVENVQASGRYHHVEIARSEGLVSLLAVPLVFEDRAIGTLNVYTSRPHLFADEEVRTLTAYAELSALALEKARLSDRLIALEDELRQSERLSVIGLLAAEIAHEIRNPLTVMKMLHHSLDLQFPADDPRQTDVRIMGEKMDHLNRIVDRVLDFARSTEPARSSVDVNQLLQDMNLLLRVKLKSHGVRLQQRLDRHLPRITGDATQLEQAFLNLAFNAIEAMQDGGQLSIQSRGVRTGRRRRRVTHVLIRFRDSGVGMTPEQTNKVFSSLLNTTKPRGTGLGMAIVSRLVEAHEGVVRVRSRPGVGTTFTVVLPVRRT